MIFLVDTNVLVYRFDPRDPRKQRIAREVLRRGIADRTARIPHQVLVEFFAVATRPLRPDRRVLLTAAEATRECEDLLGTFDVLWPSAPLFRLALRGRAAYELSWFDAHLWAYAEFHGIPRLLSEDLAHGARYGTVEVVDPFRT